MPELLQIRPQAESLPEDETFLSVDISPDFREFTQAESVEKLVRLAQEILADPTFPTARAWRKAGGKAVGCFPVYTPQELVHSFGMLPVAMQGGGENLEISRADAALGSFLCSISKSTLEMALTGLLDPFDAFVFPYICDVSRNLDGIFARVLPKKPSHMLHLPQNFASPATIPFLVAEYRSLIEKLERVAGRPFSQEDLRASIAVFNEQRALVERLAALKRETPWKVTLVEYYLLLRLGGLLPREVHVPLLRRALAELEGRERKSKDAIRVIVIGPFCEQPTLELLQLLEDVGCYVVGEEFQMLHRWCPRIEPGTNPLESLATSYVRTPVDIGVRSTPTTKAAAVLERVDASRAQGVVFLTAKFCEPALEDVVLYRRALEGRGLPYLHMEFEEKSTTYEQARLQLETFVESILFD
ncbi:MAG TPA: 2-hydroxyacyl-CoA dehydratase [Thermoplasmata archaeon]|nr:2-hydroxyacyl-CoA dehydratase [Thermoplasmata archaeon]